MRWHHAGQRPLTDLAAWDCSSAPGTQRVLLTFSDKTATAPAQILGSSSPVSGSWLWAWANESILPEMSRDARSVRDWAEAHRHPSLAQPKIAADEQAAATPRILMCHAV